MTLLADAVRRQQRTSGRRLPGAQPCAGVPEQVLMDLGGWRTRAVLARCNGIVARADAASQARCARPASHDRVLDVVLPRRSAEAWIGGHVRRRR